MNYSKLLKNNVVFILSTIVVMLVSIILILGGESFAEIVDIIFNWITSRFAWFYLFNMTLFIFIAVMLAFSKFGDRKIGEQDSIPEYNNFTWFAMLFCAGMGVGLVFWGSSEPLLHYVKPPANIQESSIEAIEFSFKSVFMHWGIHPWACYAIFGLITGYFRYNRKQSLLPSSILADFSNFRGKKKLESMINILAIFATIAGLTTSLGLGVLQVSSGLHFVFGTPDNFKTHIFLIFVITITFVFSAVSGIDKGVKWLSNINTVVLIIFAIVMVIIGPKLDMINNLFDGVGAYLDDFIRDSIDISAYGNNTWIESWRVFYWAWWIAWTPFVGAFIARISYGRTVREFFLGVIIIPTIASVIWFSIMGTMAINLFQGGILTGKEQELILSSPEIALFVVLYNYPLGKVMSIVAIVLLFLFFITSADSGTYVLSSLTSSSVAKPSNSKKIIWGFLIFCLSIGLMMTGGLRVLQTISIIAAFPFTFVILFGIMAYYKSLKRDIGKNYGK